MSPGDTIFFYTDGVTEAQNHSGELFGEDRLRAFLEVQNGRHSSPKELNAALWGAVNAFADGAEQADDVTVLTLRLTRRKPHDSALNLSSSDSEKA